LGDKVAAIMPSQRNSQKTRMSIKQFEQLIEFQDEIIQSIALSSDTQHVLDKLCLTAESLIPNSVASLILFENSSTVLRVIAAPSLTNGAVKSLERLTYLVNEDSDNKKNTVTDLLTEHQIPNLHELSRSLSIESSWSAPVKNSQNKTVGLFILFCFNEKTISGYYKKLLENSANIIGIVLQRQQQEKKLWQLVHQDPLTGLSNRKMLNIKIQDAAKKANRYKHKFALLFIDLDDFKQINDRQGHEVGDNALKTISQMLKSCTRESDSLARLGGDEFILLIEPVESPRAIWVVASKILSLFNSPLVFNNYSYTISASIGISIFPKDGTTSKDLLQHSDIAMYAAKNDGGNSAVFFEDRLTDEIHSRFELEEQLENAIKKDEFELYYQPIYQGKETKLIALEALLRWNHPHKGLILPGKFIPVAEESQLIKSIGSWVIENIVSQMSKWLKEKDNVPIVAMNISPAQLQSGFANYMIALFAKHNTPASQFEIEVTESLFLEHDYKNTASHELEILKKEGVFITLDDFGTGYSSLSQLKSLPISKLKIDRSFVMDIPFDSNDIVITQTIIEMGKNLHLNVLAEGVETLEQKEFLLEKNCDLLQGYLLAHPMKLSEVEKLF
jgi:diguanylate cyclase (GGDEF)-like protein